MIRKTTATSTTSKVKVTSPYQADPPGELP
jgi:hypothetical protein